MRMTAKHITGGAAALILILCSNLSVAIADNYVEASPAEKFVSSLNPLNWTMPDFRQLLPGNDEKARIKKKKEGLFDEVTKTASNSWTKTKRVLNPQKLNPINFLPASSRTPSPAGREDAKPGFFQSLFTPKRAEPDNATVTDFLRQSRPSP